VLEAFSGQREISRNSTNKTQPEAIPFGPRVPVPYSLVNKGATDGGLQAEVVVGFTWKKIQSSVPRSGSGGGPDNPSGLMPLEMHR